MNKKAAIMVGDAGVGTATLVNHLPKEEYIVIDRQDDEIDRFIQHFAQSPYPQLASDFQGLILDTGPKRNPRLRLLTKKRLAGSQNNKPCPCNSGLKYKKCYKNK